MDQLKLLHVTDIHCAFDRVEQLKHWLKEEGQKIDIVLISGDIANVPAELYHTTSKDLLQEHHEYLERITTDFLSVSDRVYFIPGNHDPVTFYTTSPSPHEDISFPHNVHAKKIQIAPKLHLLGLGGSVPGFSSGEKIWDGFPYVSDQKFGEDLKRLLDPVLQEESVSPEVSYILMTHNGPNSSCTTKERNPPNPTIIGGSDVLDEYLVKTKLQQHAVMNVHGHVHTGIGMSSIGSLSIINPGSLKEGKFGIYTLRMVLKRHPAWKLCCASLHRLD